MAKAPLFHKAHHEIIAAQFRKRLEFQLKFALEKPSHNSEINIYAIDAIVALAIDLAKRFEQDNPGFKPVYFLNRCSPNTTLYPLGELWNLTP